MIHRADHDEGFLMITNDLLRDKNLSLSARGLLAFMLTYSDEWLFSTDGLIETTGASRYEILCLIKELKDAGYIQTKQVKDEGGRFGSTNYEVFELPCVEIPYTEKPYTDLPYTENRTHKNTNIYKKTNIKNTKRDIYSSARFKKPSFEEVSQYCIERGNSVDPQRFMDYYESNGWKVGRNPMKDWKAAVRTWEKRDKQVPSHCYPSNKTSVIDWDELEKRAEEADKKAAGGNT